MLHYFPCKFFALLLSCGFVSCALGACAIHPLPENVTGVKTSQIVHRNRCEAAAAVFKIERWLMRHHKLAAAKALTNIGIALSYTLDMTEADSLTASTNLEQLVTHGTFSANPGAGDSLTRENKRTFTVADSYQTLGKMVDCAAEPTGSNYQYPIVGTIGIDETIQTFLTMALHEDLNGVIQDEAGKLPNEPSEYTAASPSMVETLTFTTKISASVAPQITLTPLLRSSQLKLNTASLAFSWSRQDLHEVIVGLGMPSVPTQEGHVKTLYSTISSAHGVAARARTPLLIDAVVPAESGPSSGVGLAMEAVNSQIVRFQALRQTVVLAH
jgi:hypothetical protein